MPRRLGVAHQDREAGFFQLDSQRVKLLFQVMLMCYEVNSFIVTTNIEFSCWGAVLVDDKLAAAAVDRIIHHGRRVELDGSSKRVGELLMLGK